MGQAWSTVRQRTTQCLDATGTMAVSGTIAALYFVFFVLCLTCIILLIANDTEMWPSSLAFITVLITGIFHVGLIIAGMLLIEGYQHYSVTPVPLYVGIDALEGVSLGIGIGGFVVDANAKPPMYMAVGFMMVAHAGMLYKAGTIAYDVYYERRDPRTGRKYTDDDYY